MGLKKTYLENRVLKLEVLDIETKIGKLFYFKPDLIHELRPITKGIRYSLHFPLNKKEKNII